MKVWKDPLGHGDWFFACAEHAEAITTYSWLSAYEAALGHACMHHPTHT